MNRPLTSALCAVAAAVALTALAPTASAAFMGLGTAGQYAVLTVPDTNLNLSNVTIWGNVGVSHGGQATNMAPSTINGNVYLDTTPPTATYTGPGTLNGSIFNVSLASAITDYTNAATQDAALSPTQTSGAINAPTTFTGNGGLNVIKISGNVTDSILLAGTSADIFVINITGSLNIGSSSTLGPAIGSGVTADHILYNFIGASGSLATHVGNSVYGTILAPNYSANSLDGTFYGEIIADGSSLGLLSGAAVHQVNFVPEPASLSLLALGGTALLARRRKA